MDHFPIGQTFKFENNFSTVGKSEIVKFGCKILKNVENIVNVKFANFVYFCIKREKPLPHFHIIWEWFIVFDSLIFIID